MNHVSGPAPAIGGPPSALGPAAVTWKVHREVALLAGWGRAILLQLAHPLVAEGVATHSSFARDPGGGVRRLRATLQAMLTLTFGSEAEARRVAAHINGIHDRVHGETPAACGNLPAGTRYSAHDPALLAWVHATLLDSFLVTYELFVGDLTAAERDRYCVESSRIGPLLGIPPGHLPRTHAGLQGYLDVKLGSAEIAVNDTARAVATEIVNPRLPWPARPLIPLARLATAGLLPAPIRDAYGLPWSARRDQALRVVAAASRRALPLVPPLLRYWPAARLAFAGRRGAGPGQPRSVERPE